MEKDILELVSKLLRNGYRTQEEVITTLMNSGYSEVEATNIVKAAQDSVDKGYLRTT